MRFTKMQATGNDFICVCTLEKPLPELATNAKALCNRRFGIGADGLLEIGRSQSADFSMRLWNADGSEAEMCGNGIRCLGKYVYDRGYARETCFSVETRAGVRTVEIQEGNDCTAEWIRVGMGVPEWSKLPLRWEKLSEIENWTGKQVGNELFPVSMGNPHCVVLFSEGGNSADAMGKTD